ncbi:uncharacterized protein LTR77_009537 [Saxophila tyrrhenica]|uniref:GPI anchored protein n=1 Tax=Saxophila tyrrhenica TaxID=1690608 RepID=A0AAV9NYX4_9PEZI|nr:hypothetical protein LTR77_009537 [Saxophila tyrrhenica]
MTSVDHGRYIGARESTKVTAFHNVNEPALRRHSRKETSRDPFDGKEYNPLRPRTNICQLQHNNTTTMPSSTTAMLSLLAFAFSANAALQNAIIIVSASHGGAGQDITNTTITVPMSQTYTNPKVLDEVSTLYIANSTGVPAASVTCTPYRNPDGTGDAGLAFTVEDPSELSTNTVQVGSIVCITTDISLAPPSGPPGGPVPLSSSSAVASSILTKTLSSKHATKTTGGGGGAVTSTSVKTRSAGGTAETSESTVTSMVSASGSPSRATGAAGGASNTASASTSSTSGNAASGIGLGSEFYGGLALAGFGLAFVL